MNQAPAQQKPNGISPKNLFEGVSFESKNEYEQPEVITNERVPHSEQERKNFSNDWVELFSRRTETTVETSSDTLEIQQKTIEAQFSQPLRIFDQEETIVDLKPISIIEEQKGSGSAWSEAGIKLLPDYKDIGKSIFGTFSLLKELFMDTASLFIPKKEKAAERVETDPEKARAAAEKKAENQRKRNNMSIFIQAMQAQIAAIISPDAARMETQEKANINIVGKIGQESYKGIKDSFGRLTKYAASMFEQGQKDQEKQAKKAEKENKIASIAKSGPDLNLDKVAEGGFLSSTGGQGAG